VAVELARYNPRRERALEDRTPQVIRRRRWVRFAVELLVTLALVGAGAALIVAALGGGR
jgi:hypothetical protein